MPAPKTKNPRRLAPTGVNSYLINIPLRRVADGYDRYYDVDQGDDRGDGGGNRGHVRVSHLIKRPHYSHRVRNLTSAARYSPTCARRRPNIMSGRAIVLSLLHDMHMHMRDPTEYAGSGEARCKPLGKLRFIDFPEFGPLATD